MSLGVPQKSKNRKQTNTNFLWTAACFLPKMIYTKIRLYRMTLRKVRPTSAAMSKQSSRKWETEYEQTNSWLTLYINSGKYRAPILHATCNVLRRISTVVSVMVTSSTSIQKNRCIGLAMSSIPTFPLLSLPSGFSPIRWWRLGSVWSFSLAVVSALLIPIVSFAVVSALLVPIILPVALCLLPGAVSLISIVLSVRSSSAFVLQCMWIDSDQERRMPICIRKSKAQVVHSQLSRPFGYAVDKIMRHAKFICKSRRSIDLKFLFIIE